MTLLLALDWGTPPRPHPPLPAALTAPSAVVISRLLLLGLLILDRISAGDSLFNHGLVVDALPSASNSVMHSLSGTHSLVRFRDLLFTNSRGLISSAGIVSSFSSSPSLPALHDPPNSS